MKFISALATSSALAAATAVLLLPAVLAVPEEEVSARTASGACVKAQGGAEYVRETAYCCSLLKQQDSVSFKLNENDGRCISYYSHHETFNSCCKDHFNLDADFYNINLSDK
ncbi:hypothetical protein H4219_004484 [Mycoemilia scoparia]|uniref:Uncharacterized protein n=1 Tax=Mycoemilia scoparia TaxID=417184 RepID=A0A9W7ZZM2_9FUNG|nr:hypothetical protein H4219_004484 [Mycoemilia scoparia]